MKHLHFLPALLLATLLSTGASFAQATKLVFSTPPSGALPGQPFTTQPVVQAQDDQGTMDTSVNGPVTISLRAATAPAGTVLSGTKTATMLNGEATFTDLSLNQVGSFILDATGPNNLHGETSVAVLVTFSDAWNSDDAGTPSGYVRFPNDDDPTVTLNGFNQMRAIAMNHNVGSPYAGTLYITRRSGTNQNIPGTADVFFWRAAATNAQAAAGSGTLKTKGIDPLHPDGRFDLTGLTPGGNAFWAIGVAEDDYVYVTGLTSGTLFRFKPDGTGGTLVIPSGFPRVRQFYVTGKGLTTTLWAITDNVSSSAPIFKYVASAVDANNAPTAFAKTVLFNATENISQAHQSVVNPAQDTFYFTYFAGGGGSGPTPSKYTIASGAKDTTFPAWTLSNGSGLDIDSADRLLVQAYGSAHQFVAMSTRSGVSLTNGNAGGASDTYIPTNMPNVDYGNGEYIEVSRYSDHHYFWLACDALHVGGGGDGTVAGVLSTTAPAPPATGVSTSNPGTGTSLNIAFALPNDPEVTGVDIYRSTTAGTLGSKVNTSLVTTSPYQDTGLTSNTTYYYTIRTSGLDPFTNTAYTGSDSAQIAGTPTPPGVPLPPTGITVTDTKQGNQLQVQWTTPAANADVINIYRSTNASFTPDTSNRTTQVSNPTPNAQAQYLDNTATNGVTFYYIVRAANGSGQESPNVTTVSGKATDTVLPVFAGVKSATDLGFPGVRLTWDAASDRSLPITYNIYTGDAPETINYAAPVASTTGTVFDLRLPLMQQVAIAVRARDAAGNEEANTANVTATPDRVIVDSDRNGGANNARFNPQPDPAVDALLPSPIAQPKGNAPDLVPFTFGEAAFYYQTNDAATDGTHVKHGKAAFYLPIPQPGNYTISAFWSPATQVNTPGYVYHITYPDGTKEDVTMDELGSSGGTWQDLVTGKDLTPGILTVIGDATQSTGVDAASWNVAGAMRALANSATPIVMGDVNMSGAADKTDVLTLLKIASGLMNANASGLNVFAGDLDGDGQITAMDAARLLRKINGK